MKKGKGFSKMGLSRCSIMDTSALFISKQVRLSDIDSEVSYYRSPEENLLLSVISRAYQDATRSLTASFENPNGIMAEARAWFLSDAKHVFSFLWIAEQLDIGINVINKFRSQMQKLEAGELKSEDIPSFRFFQAKLDN